MLDFREVVNEAATGFGINFLSAREFGPNVGAFTVVMGVVIRAHLEGEARRELPLGGPRELAGTKTFLYMIGSLAGLLVGGIQNQMSLSSPNESPMESSAPRLFGS